MRKISMDIYKESQIYLQLFDVLIKKENTNIESFLKENYLAPSSYRRAKEEGTKIGTEIVEHLSKYFNYKLCEQELITQIEERFNNIYYNLYYKITDNYDDDLQWIDELLLNNYLIFPILKLMKLLLMISNTSTSTLQIEEKRGIYKELKQYINFYNEDLKEVLEICEIALLEEIDKSIISRDFKNEIIYYTLASRSLLNGRYLESIYFCEKAKERYYQDENYKRIYSLNLTLLSNYNYLGRYNEAYELADRQIKSLTSIKLFEYEYVATNRFIILSCLGLKKYDEVIERLKTIKKQTLTEVASLLISYYNIDINEYNLKLENLINKNNNENIKDFLNLLNKYLKNKDKKALLNLVNYNINPLLIEILK